MSGFIDRAIITECVNLYDSYGEICTGCNACGRVNPATKHQNHLRVLRRQKAEFDNFNLWFDDPSIRAIQESNVKASSETIGREIEALEILAAQEEQEDQDGN